MEATTGPLGQGIATSVGMAVASVWQAAHFNRPGAELFDFDVYAIAGDGDLMEGVSNEAASFAGHQKLSNLCWVYDNNHISIDGHTSITYEDDVEARFQGYQWNVTRVEDANNLDMIARGFDNFQEEPERPTLIIVDSHIGYGAPAQAGHGRGARRAARRRGGPGDQALLRMARGRGVPRPRRGAGSLRRGDGQARRRAAREMGRAVRDATSPTSPRTRRTSEAMQRRELPEGWDAELPSFEPDEKGMATRKASNKVENAVGGEGSLAAGRRGRPDRIELGRAWTTPVLRADTPRRPPAALRDPRARVGGDLERPVALEAAPALVDLPDLLRLRPSGDPALGADGAAGDPPLHARLDRSR